MPSIFKYITVLALAMTTASAAAMPQGNSNCAHWCQDNYKSCHFKNVGQCVSNAAHNGFECCCPAKSDW